MYHPPLYFQRYTHSSLCLRVPVSKPPSVCVHVQAPRCPCCLFLEFTVTAVASASCVLCSSWRSWLPGVFGPVSDSTVSLGRVDGSVSKGTSVSPSRQLASGFNKVPPTTKSVLDGCVWSNFRLFKDKCFMFQHPSFMGLKFEAVQLSGMFLLLHRSAS